MDNENGFLPLLGFTTRKQTSDGDTQTHTQNNIPFDIMHNDPSDTPNLQ